MANIFRNVDCAQSRMSDRTAHESDLARSGETKIGDILSATVQEAVVLFPENGGSDSVLPHQRTRVAGAKTGKYVRLFLVR
jgi:hypothetical protein